MPDFCAEADVTIVGAGAAGLATAAFLGRLKNAQNVTLLDSAAKPGAKILISGGSRCNVTNVSISELDFWGGHRTAIRRVLRALPVADTVEFFNRIGVRLHEEADGKLFPTSNRARDVLSALLGEVARVGVVLRSGWQVLDIKRIGNHFHLTTNHGLVNTARVVLATGGRSLPKSGSDGRGYALAAGLGHSLVTTTPGLAPLVFETNGSEPPQLSGVAQAAELTLWVNDKAATRLRGQLLWTHFGISGPVALNMSRHWARARLSDNAVRLTLSCCPGMTFEQADERLLTLIRERPRAAVTTLLSSFLPAAVSAALVQNRRDRCRHGRRSTQARRPPSAGACAGRVAAAGRRHARIYLRRGHGRRRLTRRDRPLDDGIARVPGSSPRRRDSGRGRPDRRVQLPVGVVDGVRGRERACRRVNAGRPEGRPGS